MNKTELKSIYFSFFDQLTPEHAEKAKANYDEDWHKFEPKTHQSAVIFGFEWTESPEGKTYWGDIFDSLSVGEYPLQLTPQVCKDKAIERMATGEDYEKLEDVVRGIKATVIYEPPSTEPNFGTKGIALPEDAAERKTYPIYSGFMTYFPHAIAAVSHLSYLGNLQHHPDKPLHWDMNKSSDERDAMMRHVIDGDWEQVAWRALANLERKLTNQCTYDS